MLTTHERSQLMKEYQRRPASAIGLVVTSLVGLLLIVVLAMVGIDIHRH